MDLGLLPIHLIESPNQKIFHHLISKVIDLYLSFCLLNHGLLGEYDFKENIKQYN